jgi:transposase InsO family protein
VKCAFILAEAHNHGPATLCRVLGVKPNKYYAWRKKGGVSKREARRAELFKLIYKIFVDNRKSYGARRVYQELKKQGVKVSKATVESIMREHALAPKRTRSNKSTTDSKHQLPVSENLLNRNFLCKAPDLVWVSDITYIETHEGWLYLTVFQDLFSRMVVGWSITTTMHSSCVVDAFNMGVERRGTKPVMVHSDRGSQYASEAFRSCLVAVEQSMSRKGDCWDNAVAETFWKTLKAELIYREVFKTREAARLAIFEYIETFYNKRRLHSTLGYLSPMEFELKVQKAA